MTRTHNHLVHKRTLSHLAKQLILSALQKPTYKLAKYLDPILESLPTNKYTVKDSFNFATETAEQDSSNFMVSLDIDSLFINITLEETTEICTNNLSKNNNIVHGLKKSKFKERLSLTTKESYLIIYYRNKLTK